MTLSQQVRKQFMKDWGKTKIHTCDGHARWGARWILEWMNRSHERMVGYKMTTLPQQVREILEGLCASVSMENMGFKASEPVRETALKEILALIHSREKLALEAIRPYLKHQRYYGHETNGAGRPCAVQVQEPCDCGLEEALLHTQRKAEGKESHD